MSQNVPVYALAQKQVMNLLAAIQVPPFWQITGLEGHSSNVPCGGVETAVEVGAKTLVIEA